VLPVQVDWSLFVDDHAVFVGIDDDLRVLHTAVLFLTVIDVDAVAVTDEAYVDKEVETSSIRYLAEVHDLVVVVVVVETSSIRYLAEVHDVVVVVDHHYYCCYHNNRNGRVEVVHDCWYRRCRDEEKVRTRTQLRTELKKYDAVLSRHSLQYLLPHVVQRVVKPLFFFCLFRII
jgi:hypothetical protein